MSCHQTHGGVATTAWARASTDLDDGQVASIYHRIKRAAADAPAPDPDEVRAWIHRTRRELEADPDLAPKQRDRIHNRLNRAERALDTGDLPDGATFAAWQRTPIEAASAAAGLDALIAQAARQQRINPDRMGPKFRRWRDRNDYEDIESPDPDFRISTDGLPSDKATARALRKLGWENYLAQRLPVFTYGTLRAGQHNEHLMDGAIAERTGGRIDGVAIYGPGRGFPYAQESPDGEGYTVGDLVHLAPDWNGDQSRQSLDMLEGFNSDRYNDSHYRRVTRDVAYTDAAGTQQTTKAWVYLAGRHVRGGLREDERIHDGDWVAARQQADTRYASYYSSVRRRQVAPDSSDDGEFTGTYRIIQSSTDTPARSARDSAAAFEALFAATEGDRGADSDGEPRVTGIPRRSAADRDADTPRVAGIPRRSAPDRDADTPRVAGIPRRSASDEDSEHAGFLSSQS